MRSGTSCLAVDDAHPAVTEFLQKLVAAEAPRQPSRADRVRRMGGRRMTGAVRIGGQSRQRVIVGSSGETGVAGPSKSSVASWAATGGVAASRSRLALLDAVAGRIAPPLRSFPIKPIVDYRPASSKTRKNAG